MVFAMISGRKGRISYIVDENYIDDDDNDDNERADVFLDTLHTLREKVGDRQTVVNERRAADG